MLLAFIATGLVIELTPGPNMAIWRVARAGLAMTASIAVWLFITTKHRGA